MAACSFHTHELGRLTVGCPECIRQTRAAEHAARWGEAPLRTVTWKCTYRTLATDGREVARGLSFTLKVGVPDDATGQEVDVEYLDVTGEAFMMALPDDVPMDLTQRAIETMQVRSVTIGPRVTPPDPVPIDQPSLFGEAS